MGRRIFLALPWLAIWPAASPAREFWEAKEPGAWTPGEIHKLITQSPWAITSRLQPTGGFAIPSNFNLKAMQYRGKLQWMNSAGTQKP
jgi:hypothetical protein